MAGRASKALKPPFQQKLKLSWERCEMKTRLVALPAVSL